MIPRPDAILPAPFAAIGVYLGAGALLRLELLPRATPSWVPDTPLVREIAAQLEAYFADPAQRFDLPLAPCGTVFRRRVWQALPEIPVGQTLSYAELARRVGSGARAVGQALGDNPWPIILPCHRVVAAHGLGGFNHSVGGDELESKRWLLAHEGAHALIPQLNAHLPP